MLSMDLCSERSTHKKKTRGRERKRGPIALRNMPMSAVRYQLVRSIALLITENETIFMIAFVRGLTLFQKIIYKSIH